ncbi:hypothetical protein ACIA5D_02535 [Actinoplanes sp. NPDC051513]
MQKDAAGLLATMGTLHFLAIAFGRLPLQVPLVLWARRVAR